VNAKKILATSTDGVIIRTKNTNKKRERPSETEPRKKREKSPKSALKKEEGDGGKPTNSAPLFPTQNAAETVFTQPTEILTAAESEILTAAESEILPHGHTENLLHGQAEFLPHAQEDFDAGLGLPPADYGFLLRRRLEKDVTDLTGTLLLRAGSLVDGTVIKTAKNAGKLVDLTLNSVKIGGLW
jgi:hypothetical protein